MEYDTKFKAALLSIVFCVFSACQQKRTTSANLTDESPDGLDWGDSETAGKALNLQNAPNFTDADKAAMGKVAQQANVLMPKAGSGLSPDLLDELYRLAALDPRSVEVSAQKYALAGKILLDCAGKLSQPSLTPQPGDPLMGVYSMFETNTEGFAADRGLKSTIARQGGGLVLLSPYCVGAVPLAVVPDGGASGAVCIFPESAYNTSPLMFTDKPQAANGDYHGHNTAGDFDVWTFFNLETSQNPIPGKYDEAMKQTSLCYRQALFS